MFIYTHTKLHSYVVHSFSGRQERQERQERLS
jgi:hypothetical protein